MQHRVENIYNHVELYKTNTINIYAVTETIRLHVKIANTTNITNKINGNAREIITNKTNTILTYLATAQQFHSAS